MSFAALAERSSRQPLRSKFTAALVAASAIAALYVARPVLIPASLALLIAFALAPVVDALGAFKIKRLAAVLAAVGLAAALLASVALFLGAQFAELAGATPGPASLRFAAGLVEPLLNPLSSAGAAVVMAAFALFHREKIVEPFARFAALHDAADIADAGREFGRYLLTQGVLDLSFGTVVALGLWAIGVPNFGLWALLGVMLRSVPFVGVAVAALCPLMLAGRFAPTALGICGTLLLFLAVDGALRAVERRWLRRTGARLSAFAAVGATVLWTCLWGLTGLLLAMPLTLGAVMLGGRFQALRVLDVLLVHPPCDPAAPALPEPNLTHKGDPALRALVAARDDFAAAATLDRDEAPAAPDRRHDGVLCIAGPGIMDEAAAGLLAEALRRKGLNARAVRFEDTKPANLPLLDVSDVRAVCFSCLDARDAPALRRLVRRVRPRVRGAGTVAGLWGWDGGALMDAGTVECDLITTRLHEAAQRIERLMQHAGAARAQAA